MTDDDRNDVARLHPDELGEAVDDMRPMAVEFGVRRPGGATNVVEE